MYNQTLPFSLTQFQQTYFISGLPHSNNIIPTIYPTEPGISMTRLAAGYYRQQLRDNAGKNVLRCFNYNRCSQNNFCNDDFTIGVKRKLWIMRLPCFSPAKSLTRSRPQRRQRQ